MRTATNPDQIQCPNCAEYYDPYPEYKRWHSTCEERQEKLVALNEMVSKNLLTYQEYKIQLHDLGFIFRWN